MNSVHKFFFGVVVVSAVGLWLIQNHYVMNKPNPYWLATRAPLLLPTPDDWNILLPTQVGTLKRD